jgi:hypothetical protein
MKIILSAVIFLALLAVDSGEAMTDEDVVRLFVSGSSTEEIIGIIENSEVDFDLSNEMIDELRAAGLPQELIQAMIDRQGVVPEESPPDAQEPAGPSLRIEIAPGKPLRLLDVIDAGTREHLRLRDPESRLTDLAIFLACLTQDHVPDHWRGKSPLGRDFINMPRHRMLYFGSGAVATELGKLKRLTVSSLPGDGPLQAMLELELPSAIEVELAAGVAHDLMLGVALQAEEKYHLIASDDWKGLVLEEEDVTSSAAVRVGKDRRLASVRVLFAER